MTESVPSVTHNAAFRSAAQNVVNSLASEVIGAASAGEDAAAALGRSMAYSGVRSHRALSTVSQRIMSNASIVSRKDLQGIMSSAAGVAEGSDGGSAVARSSSLKAVNEREGVEDDANVLLTQSFAVMRLAAAQAARAGALDANVEMTVSEGSGGAMALASVPIRTEGEAKPPSIVYPAVTLANLVAVCGFSILGVASRVFFGILTGEQHFFGADAYFAPNFIGTFILGLVVGSPLKSGLPHTQTGITVGFCGAFTTFSSWMLATTAAKDVNTGIVEFISGMCFPMIAFVIGRDAAGLLPGTMGHLPRLDVAIVASGVTLAACMIAALGVWRTAVIGFDTTAEAVLFTSILGPVGATVRYLLSLRLNTRFKPIPVGTFTANVLAFILVSALYRCGAKEKVAWCNYASVGIGGALSTVSSWAFDTLTLLAGTQKWRAYAYALGTAAVGCAITSITVKLV